MELDSYIILDVKVIVYGKGEKGVFVIYIVGKEFLEIYDGIFIFGFY